MHIEPDLPLDKLPRLYKGYTIIKNIWLCYWVENPQGTDVYTLPGVRPVGSESTVNRDNPTSFFLDGDDVVY